MTTKRSLAHRLYTGETSVNFIGLRKRWYILSAILVILCFLSLAVRGLTLGIEFSGGTDFQVPMSIEQGTVEEVRQVLSSSDVADLEPQVFALGDTTLRVQTRSLDPTETTTVRVLIAELADVSPDDVAYSAIGPSWGAQVSQQALVALVVFVLLVMVLIWAWFRDWRMSLAAIIPLAHDAILTVGIYSAVGFTVTPATLIGVLTILGYSLYDTVVVFDQVRRNTRNLDDVTMAYGELVNRSTNQVLIRSMNTTVIGILPVTGLLIAGIMLGGGPLGDLGLALFIGMLAGAYSSIFLAAPLLVEFNKREPRIREHDERIARLRAETAPAVVTTHPGVGDAAEPEVPEPDPEDEKATATAATRSSRQQRRTHTTRAQRKQR